MADEKITSTYDDLLLRAQILGQEYAWMMFFDGEVKNPNHVSYGYFFNGGEIFADRAAIHLSTSLMPCTPYSRYYYECWVETDVDDIFEFKGIHRQWKCPYKEYVAIIKELGEISTVTDRPIE